MIKGCVILRYEDENINARKYCGRKQRNEIINSWTSLYALKNKPFEIIICPEIDERDIAGVLELRDEKENIIDKIPYYSTEEREESIEECKKYYEKFSITIKPKV
jgi:hypothetical protein